MNFFYRIRSAVRLLIKGDPHRHKRAPIPAITSTDLADIRLFFPREKFFIFGHARSGTTLLMRLIRLHPEVHCNYQAHFFTRKPLLKSLVDNPEAEEWLARKSNRWNRDRDLSALVLRAAADFIMERDAVAAGKNIVGDKSPSSNIHGQAVRDLQAIYPDAKLIYIVRDGRDVVVSERFRNFVEESKYLSARDKQIIRGLRNDPNQFMNGNRSIFTDTFLRRVARNWMINVVETDQEGKDRFGSNYCPLRFEDLLAEPFNVMTGIWNFLGVKQIDGSLAERIVSEMSSNPDEEWQARRNGDLASLLQKGQAGNWQSLFSGVDKAIFKELAGPALIEWKYEKDDHW